MSVNVEDRQKRRLDFERALWRAEISPARSERYVEKLMRRLEDGEPEADLIAEAVEEEADLEARIANLRRSRRGGFMYPEF